VGRGSKTNIISLRGQKEEEGEGKGKRENEEDKTTEKLNSKKRQRSAKTAKSASVP